MSEKNKKKCSFKCNTCTYFDKTSDYCKEKEIENVTKQPHTDFSTCESYLVSDKIIYF